MALKFHSYPRALRATPPPCPFQTAFVVCFIYKSRWNVIPESTETSTNNGEQFSEICTTNRWQITPEGKQMSKNRDLGRSWGCVGRVLEPSGRGPAQMHFRMRKPRSWLTLWGWLLVQFALLFALFCVVFSTMHPERHFIDFCTIPNTFSKTFGEVFGEGLK